VESAEVRDDQHCSCPRAHLVALTDLTLEPIALEVECDGEVVDASERVDLKK
jgi:hypothetical protein